MKDGRIEMADKRISISISNETLEKLENISKQFNVTKSQFISLVLDSVLTESMDQSFVNFITGLSKLQ